MIGYTLPDMITSFIIGALIGIIWTIVMLWDNIDWNKKEK